VPEIILRRIRGIRGIRVLMELREIREIKKRFKALNHIKFQHFSLCFPLFTG
jgi:hypothetical protein